ncbi:MAG: PEP-CTERM sorting domain-containing protein [Rhodocyclaceae bacterium]|nr:PEP-CTERM sorting domain-containing protein [Rhodocyclaceae bacterium]
MKPNKTACFLLALGTLLTVSSGAQAVTYQYHALPLIGGSTYSGGAYGVNDSGVAVGWSYVGTNNYVHAAEWTSLTNVVDLGSLAGNNDGARAEAHAINNNGDIAGWSWNAQGYYRAFSAPAGGVMTNLGTSGGANSQGYAINDNGVIAGWSTNGSGYTHAATYNGAWNDLGALDAGYQNTGYGYGINNAGTVAGKSLVGLATTTASYYDGTWHNLGTLVADYGHSGAYDINNNGWIVGWSSDPVLNVAPFLWTPGGGMTQIGFGFIGGQTNRGAYAINDLNMVVGSSIASNGQAHAFLYQNSIVDLNDPNVVGGLPGGQTFLTEAYGISENGNYIVGITNNYIPFILTRDAGPAQAPEPASLLLLAGGLAGLAAAACKSKYPSPSK